MFAFSALVVILNSTYAAVKVPKFQNATPIQGNTVVPFYMKLLHPLSQTPGTNHYINKESTVSRNEKHAENVSYLLQVIFKGEIYKTTIQVLLLFIKRTVLYERKKNQDC